MAAKGVITHDSLTTTTGVASLTFTVGGGSRFGMIQAAPHDNFVSAKGTVIVAVGRNTQRFQDCIIDKASRPSSGDTRTISYVIRNRLWKYEEGGGVVSGWYNRRKKSGELDPDTERTPKELADLLARAMRMDRFDFADLPNEQRPEVDWDNARPWPSLMKLFAVVGCRIALDTDDVIRVYELGRGRASLPRAGRVNPPSPGVSNIARPDGLVILGERVAWEVLFELEAIGLDEDDHVRMLGEMAYWPDDNWTMMEPGKFDLYPEVYEEEDLTTVQRQNIAKARTSAYRWYRLKQLADGTLKLPLFPRPGHEEDVVDVQQFYPLGVLIEKKKDGFGRERNIPAYLEGEFVSEDVSSSKPATRWDEGFSIDSESGIVKLSRPAYRDHETKGYQPAKLYLRTMCYLRDNKGGWIRYWKERRLGRNLGTGPLPIRRDELTATISVPYRYESFSEFQTPGANIEAIYAAGEPENNAEEVNPLADRFLDYYASEFGVEDADSNYFNGFVGRLDGRLRQITWQLADGVAMTQMSLSSEHDPRVPKYEQIKKEFDAARQAEIDKAADKLKQNSVFDVGSAGVSFIA